MSQDNIPRRRNQWPKAMVVIIGIIGICAVSYCLKEPDIMLSLFILLLFIKSFD